MNTGDTAWVLTASALVLLMTPGLAFFYGGLVRKKNIVSTLMYSFVSMGLVGIVWVLWGYSLAFGPDLEGWQFIGNLEWFALKDVSANEAGPYSDTIPHQAFMIFQAMFAIITPALVTGAFAERMKFGSLCVFIVLWVTIVYAPLAHWVWGGGWLGDLGALDFAGGTVVHISAGAGALAGALVIGRRRGFPEQPMGPANVPMVLLGAALLWFGWFGFNAGSSLSADGVATNAFVVTNAAAAAAMMSWLILAWLVDGKPSAVGAASGAVAGLVAITPAAGFVGPMPALIIGLGAGVFCYGMVKLLLRLKVDDALAVFGVHGVGGIWGALATGIFVGVGYAALGDGVTRWEQIGNQLVGIVAAFAWSLFLTTVIMLAIKYTIGLSVDEVGEGTGLDVSEHGETAYEP
ncbi:MAG: ammonia channel protein [Dehalococcoidia bacterium]|nr:ammonia channel protein [Dehalococcoidia bacterium]|tara:strand:- start:670 stop:1884 length:1215 start_codon:yes stop_codon:yes gene_type:complete